MSEQLVINEVEFSAIKQNLINYYSTQPEFQDVNFEGSGINYLLDALSYVTHYLCFLGNMQINEAFLKVAQLPENIRVLARQLNYQPRRVTGAEAICDLSIKIAHRPTDPSKVITIPKYTDFLTNGYHFYATKEYLLTNSNSYTFTDMILRQGILKTYTEISDGSANHSILLESVKIDNDTLELYVDGILWENTSDLVSYEPTSLMYQIEITDDGYTKIIFGDDILGKIPPINANIEIFYTETEGLLGNNLSSFNLNEIITDGTVLYDNSKCTITVTEQSLGGADAEDIESIRLNAPRFYESQNRCLSTKDWLGILSQHQLVESINVWGGEEDLSDPKYGRVFVCVKPPSPNIILTDNQKNTIRLYIKERNILAIPFSFVDVNPIYIDISGIIYFSQQYESVLSTVRANVSNAINTFFTSTLIPFNSMFKEAKFITAINDLTEIQNTTLTFSPFVYFTKNSLGAYRWNLENELVPGTIICNYVDGWYDNGLGNLKTKKTGNAIIGTADYVNGIIEVFPGYSFPTTLEPAKGYRLDFNVINNDIFYSKNRMVQIGTTSLEYTRYV